MKMKEILEKQGEQLDQELVEKLKHLYDLRSQAVTEKLEDPSQIAKTRKDIARIKTILHERVLKDQKAKEPQKAQKAQKAPAKAKASK